MAVLTDLTRANSPRAISPARSPATGCGSKARCRPTGSASVSNSKAQSKAVSWRGQSRSANTAMRDGPPNGIRIEQEEEEEDNYEREQSTEVSEGRSRGSGCYGRGDTGGAGAGKTDQARLRPQPQCEERATVQQYGRVRQFDLRVR